MRGRAACVAALCAFDHRLMSSSHARQGGPGIKQYMLFSRTIMNEATSCVISALGELELPHCVQAWVNGLEHFLSSNPPADVLPDVADILYASSSGGEIIVRTMNGSAGSRHGPALGMCVPGPALLDVQKNS